MSQTTINIRIDEDLKAKFNRFCEETGLTMSAAFCMFAKDTVRNQQLPFVVTTKKRRTCDPFWSDENQKRLLESAKEMEETGGKIKEVKETAIVASESQNL